MTGPRRARSAAAKGTRSERPRSTAKDRALGLLAVRWRSRVELERRLRAAGYPPEEVEEALADLEAAGLIDDARFAQELVRSRTGRRLSGDRAIRSDLRGKGVGQDVVDGALEGLPPEEERAFELAAARATRMGSTPPEAAYRRIVGLLQRRGFGPSLAREAAQRAVADAFPSDEAPEPVG